MYSDAMANSCMPPGPPKRREMSVEIGSLEAEYIQMMRGISGKPGFKDGPTAPATPATPQTPVVAGAYSVAGAAAHPQEVAKVFTITKLQGQGTMTSTSV